MSHWVSPAEFIYHRIGAGRLIGIFAMVLIITSCAPGCAPKSYVVLLESPDGSTGKVIVTGSKGEQILTMAGAGTSVDGSTRPALVDQQKIKDDFGDVIAARPRVPVRYQLYFIKDTILTPKSENLISEILAEAATRPAVDLSVIGHTDTVATTEYNEQLSLKRATVVAVLLRQKGLQTNSLTIESHGKRNLLIPTPDNTFEPRNRRVEVSIR